MTEDKVLLAQWAKSGAALGIDCGRMCVDCAFKSGTDANNDDNATQAAIFSIQSDGYFNCHTSDFQNANKPCAGFQYAKAFIESPEFFKSLKIKR